MAGRARYSGRGVETTVEEDAVGREEGRNDPAGARAGRVAAAEVAAVIERLAVALALAEEPARFMAVLEAAPDRR